MKESVIGWGSSGVVEKVGWGSYPMEPRVGPSASILFLVGGEFARKRSQELARVVRNRRNVLASVIDTAGAQAADFSLATLVVIGTCRQSIDVGSPTQRAEARACSALQANQPVVMLCEHLHEVLPPHFGPVRSKVQLFLSSEDPRVCPGLWDMMPLGAMVHPVGESDVGDVASELLRLVGK